LLFFALLVLGACSPALDWREAQAPGAGLTLLFPCKPQFQDRSVQVAGQSWSATLMACDAGGMTFAALALSAPDSHEKGIGDAARFSNLLPDLAQSAVARWGPLEGEQAAPGGVRLPSGAQSQWTRHLKRTKGTTTMVTHALFIATPKGLAQLSVHGEHLSESALENFLGQWKAVH
jgi:hypothetical protein